MKGIYPERIKLSHRDILCYWMLCLACEFFIPFFEYLIHFGMSSNNSTKLNNLSYRNKKSITPIITYMACLLRLVILFRKNKSSIYLKHKIDNSHRFNTSFGSDVSLNLEHYKPFFSVIC